MSNDVLIPQHGDIVRVLRSTPHQRREAIYGIVIAVANRAPENLGTRGEPTISVAVLDPTIADPAKLGSYNWPQEFSRFVGLHHVSHTEGLRAHLAWVDVLPRDGAAYSMGALNLEDLTKPAVDVEQAKVDKDAVLYSNNGFNVTSPNPSEYLVASVPGEDAWPGPEESYSFGNLAAARSFVDSRPIMNARNMAPLTPDNTDPARLSPVPAPPPVLPDGYDPNGTEPTDVNPNQASAGFLSNAPTGLASNVDQAPAFNPDLLVYESNGYKVYQGNAEGTAWNIWQGAEQVPSATSLEAAKAFVDHATPVIG